MKDDYMWMESKEDAFDVIASMIFYQDPIEAQDRWLMVLMYGQSIDGLKHLKSL